MYGTHVSFLSGEYPFPRGNIVLTKTSVALGGRTGCYQLLILPEFLC